MTTRLTVEQIDALPFYDLADAHDLASGYFVGIILDVNTEADAAFLFGLLAALPTHYTLSHVGKWNAAIRPLVTHVIHRAKMSERFSAIDEVTDLPKWLASVGLVVMRSGPYTDAELIALACGRSVVKSDYFIAAAQDAACELEGWSGGYARKNRQEAKLVAEGKLPRE